MSGASGVETTKLLNSTSLSGLEGLRLPKMLVGPPKLYEVITQFNDYRYFLLEGGRNGGKSQFVARFLLWLGDVCDDLNIVCGREVQNKIEESVYALLVEIIKEYDLPYKILSTKIKHRTNGTEFTFRGFQDMSAEDIKGLQGVDILWVDEAQSLQRRSVTNIIPTIRKNTSKLIFTMNRFLVSDAVYDDMVGRENCLHINITYLDNPFCPSNQIGEAELMKKNNLKEYGHVWLGLPRASAEDYVFDAEKLHKSYSLEPVGDLLNPGRVLSIDFAAQGNDNCVATVLDRITNQNWRPTTRLPWSEPDPMVSVGKIVCLIGEYKPNVTVLDIGGAGYVVWSRLNELGLDVKQFDGGSTHMVDTVAYANQRAEGYFITKDWFDNSFICMDRKDEVVIKQLEKIRMKYRSNGQRVIQSKIEMKKEMGQSPDDADSLMMGIWAAVKFLGKFSAHAGRGVQPKRVTRSRHQIRV